MIPLDFDCSVGHPVDGLVDDDGSVRLFHYLVDLVAAGSDQQGNHAFGNENNDGKCFALDFFENLVDVTK